MDNGDVQGNEVEATPVKPKRKRRSRRKRTPRKTRSDKGKLKKPPEHTLVKRWRVGSLLASIRVYSLIRRWEKSENLNVNALTLLIVMGHMKKYVNSDAKYYGLTKNVSVYAMNLFVSRGWVVPFKIGKANTFVLSVTGQNKFKELNSQYNKAVKAPSGK